MRIPFPYAFFAAAAVLFAALAAVPAAAQEMCSRQVPGGFSCTGTHGGQSADFAGSCTPTTRTEVYPCETVREERNLSPWDAASLCNRGMVIQERGPESGAACHADAVTALQVCIDAGYQGYRNMRHGGYHSPGDNGLIRWMPGPQRYYGYNARTLGNNRLEGLTCWRDRVIR